MTLHLNAMTKTIVFSAVAAIASFAQFGCSQARFTDASPSVRSFTDNERTNDYYVGFDLNFILEQDTPHVPGLQRDVR